MDYFLLLGWLRQKQYIYSIDEKSDNIYNVILFFIKVQHNCRSKWQSGWYTEFIVVLNGIC